MAKTLQKKIKFSKGQVSPELIERTDLDFYDSSAQELKNFISTIYGGVRSRQGTKYIDYITNVDEDTPDSITSDIFNDTSHFTDLTPVESPTLSTNKLLAQMDYGQNQDGSCRIEIKNIRIVPYVVEKTSAGTYSEYLESGEYQVDIVGAGGGGATANAGTTSSVWSTSCAGAGGGYVHGFMSISQGTYQIVVGAGGVGKQETSYGWVQATSGGDSSFDGQIAYGGRYGRVKAYGIEYDPATGGGTSTTLIGETGNGGGYSNVGGWTPSGASGGTSKYNSVYGKGGDNNQNGNGGYVKISLYQPSYNLVFSGSKDGVNWTEIATKNISTTAYDISVHFGYRYRYVKIELSGNDNLQSKIAFSYIRNDLSASNQGDLPVKMHKFIYNNEDRYLLVLVDEKAQIFKDDVLVQIVTATGMSRDYVRDVKVAYKDDTIILTHPEMPPKQLQRQYNGTWVWSNFPIKNTPYYAFGGETSTTKSVGITPSKTEGSIKITADSSIFDSSWVGQYIDGNGGRVRITEYTSDTVVKGVTVVPFYTEDKITSWQYISGYEAVWSAQRGYPSTCLFAQQRLWFGGSKSLPAHIWASRLDDYNNFKNAGNYENDAIDITMLTNNRIMNMIEQRGIHIFTSGDEWTIQEGTYSPDKITVVKNTNNGSFGIEPVILSGSVCFIEKNGKSLLSYIYNYEQSSFITENISLFSNLIQSPIALDTEVNSSKDKSDFIYLVLSDGTMLTGCMLLDQKITSISEFKTAGSIKDVCCLLDEVYLLVDRNGTLCLEKLSNVKTDCTKQEYITSTQVSDLYNYTNNYVYVYNDNVNYGKELVVGDTVILEKNPNDVCNIGLAFDYRLESNPIAINGKTTSIKKRISKATITCKNTKELEFNGQKKKSKDDIFDFYSCTKYGNDVRFIVIGEFSPVEILSVLLNINYEG